MILLLKCILKSLKHGVLTLSIFAFITTTYSLPARAEDNVSIGDSSAESVNVPNALKVITSEYTDDITFNHPLFVDRLQNGNYLIARVGFKDPSVQEVNQSGKVLWSLKGVQPVSARRLSNGNTLVADSGAPGRPYFPRVMEVSPAGQIVWEHRFDSLAQSPRYAEKLDNGNILVTLPFMLMELDQQKRVVWSYGSGKPQQPGSPGYMERPVMATGLPGGNVLLVDRGFAGGRVMEINRSNKQVVWQFGYSKIEKATSKAAPQADDQTASNVDSKYLTDPSYAVRLPGGSTLITDLGTRRLLEVDKSGNIIKKLSWSGALQNYPVMNTWQAVPFEDKLMLVLTLTSSRSRVLELDTAALSALK